MADLQIRMMHPCTERQQRKGYDAAAPFISAEACPREVRITKLIGEVKKVILLMARATSPVR